MEDAPSPAPAPLILTKELRELQGVGGWLMWFCIVLIFIQPVIYLAEAAQNPDLLIITLDLALAALSATTGILLYRTNPAAFSWLWWYFGVLVVIAVLSFMANYFDENEVSFRDKIQPFRTLFFTAVWFSYFKVSKRVLATFGRNL